MIFKYYFLVIIRHHIFMWFYGEYNALFNIETLEMIEGDLPNRAKKLTIEWATHYQKELLEMWTTQQFHKLPPLE